MKNALILVGTYVFFVCLAYAPEWLGWTKGARPPVEKVVTDTVYLPDPYPDTVYLPVEKQTAPNKVSIYQKQDTARRKRIEKSTLVAGVRIRPSELELERLTPVGVSMVSEFKAIPEFAMIEIDAQGHVSITVDEKAAKKAKMRKFLRKVLNTAKTVGAVVLTVVVVKKIDEN